jgi:hypothetical protein
MKLFEFEILSDSEKIGYLYKHGVYIGKQKEERSTSVLYQLDCFYVEVTYRKYRQYIERINSFASVSMIDPYLEQINVEHLVYQ